VVGPRRYDERVASLDDVYLYFRAYDKTSFTVFAAGADAPGEQEIAEFEAQAGFALPADFRSFTMSWLGGLYMEVREEHWPRAQRHDVGPFWSFLYAIKVFGIAGDIPEWLDIRVQHEELAQPGLVPFLQREGDPAKYCFTPDGRIVHWHSDEPDSPQAIGKDFPTLLMHEIAELEERMRRKQEAL